MTTARYVAAVYAVILGLASLLNYIPGLTDPSGRVFGIFALDLFDDALHVLSALWATFAAWRSHAAAILFLRLFGFLYLLDGLFGLAIGSGFLDLGVVKYGVLDLPLTFKVLANLPHIGLGGIALASGFLFAQPSGARRHA